MRRITIILLLFLLPVACAQGDDGQEAGANPNSQDVQFVKDMIPHHEQAIEMAELVDERTNRPQLVQLSEDIISSQSSEIDKMSSWLDQWGEEEPSGAMGHGGEHESMSMPGMMTAQEMQDMMKLQGRAFDLAFTEMMINHHQGAIEMAQTELDEGSSEEVQDLARQISDDQREEIEQMRAWQRAWR